jgi:hypothetical protein
MSQRKQCRKNASTITNDAVERHPSFSAPTLLIARLKLSAS